MRITTHRYSESSGSCLAVQYVRRVTTQTAPRPDSGRPFIFVECQLRARSHSLWIIQVDVLRKKTIMCSAAKRNIVAGASRYLGAARRRSRGRTGEMIRGLGLGRVHRICYYMPDFRARPASLKDLSAEAVQVLQSLLSRNRRPTNVTTQLSAGNIR